MNTHPGFYNGAWLPCAPTTYPDNAGSAYLPQFGGLRGLGVDPTPTADQPPMPPPAPLSATWLTASMLIGVAATVAGIYHGYHRNHESVGWGLGWGLFAGALPILAVPLMFVEGVGKPK